MDPARAAGAVGHGVPPPHAAGRVPVRRSGAHTPRRRCWQAPSTPPPTHALVDARRRQGTLAVAAGRFGHPRRAPPPAPRPARCAPLLPRLWSFGSNSHTSVETPPPPCRPPWRPCHGSPRSPPASSTACSCSARSSSSPSSSQSCGPPPRRSSRPPRRCPPTRAAASPRPPPIRACVTASRRSSAPRGRRASRLRSSAASPAACVACPTSLKRWGGWCSASPGRWPRLSWPPRGRRRRGGGGRGRAPSSSPRGWWRACLWGGAPWPRSAHAGGASVRGHTAAGETVSPPTGTRAARGHRRWGDR
ncbi:hypothetical protein BU14_0254s0011 [Porphyra umbilicalis]|uniref:Uncharacterized protein n=1 Tax=Porphyra umbilicalis TaxID=2786 RepID=A0A1X6P2N8_PORUM|nr:hypothetical protein BU14_0254s0011 [Porphyra umbilicalis]|eukprot:OSX75131.1 hypothetical protein BU14_0254s0011 [Porphyra umbilicalis]